MSYTAPQKDMLFALEHIANMPAIIQDLNLDLDMDTVAGILMRRPNSIRTSSHRPIKSVTSNRPFSKMAQ